MLRALRPRSVYDVFALVALVVAVGGTSAYAANTVFSSDIVDGEVKSVDIGNGEVNSADVKDQSLTTFDVSTFLGADVVDNTLTGADINESSLSLPPTTTAAFAGPSNPPIWLDDAFIRIAGKNLPAGSYAIAATANMTVAFSGVRDAVCELRNGSGFIGGATDRRENPASNSVKISLSMNGGAQVPAGGGEVSLWCRYQNARPDLFLASVSYAQMMIVRLDGFF
jgi:hypothetical protein